MFPKDTVLSTKNPINCVSQGFPLIPALNEESFYLSVDTIINPRVAGSFAKQKMKYMKCGGRGGKARWVSNDNTIQELVPVDAVSRAVNQEVLDILNSAKVTHVAQSIFFGPPGGYLPTNSIHQRKAIESAKELNPSSLHILSII